MTSAFSKTWALHDTPAWPKTSLTRCASSNCCVRKLMKSVATSSSVSNPFSQPTQGSSGTAPSMHWAGPWCCRYGLSIIQRAGAARAEFGREGGSSGVEWIRCECSMRNPSTASRSLCRRPGAHPAEAGRETSCTGALVENCSKGVGDAPRCSRRPSDEPNREASMPRVISSSALLFLVAQSFISATTSVLSRNFRTSSCRRAIQCWSTTCRWSLTALEPDSRVR